MTEADHTDLLTRLSDERARLVERVAPHAVALRAGRRRFGGFAWRPGLIVAPDEALPECDEVRATLTDPASGERRTHVTGVVGRDASTDVAVLRLGGEHLDGEAGHAPVANAPIGFTDRTLAPGTSVFVVSAGEAGPVVAGGVVASVGPEWRSLRGGRIDARVELDVRLPRASEGAPVFDTRGEALGMAVTGPRRRVLLIPGATIERVASALERDGHIARGRVGATLRSIALDGGGRGLVVASVEADGPAAHAGLHQGDLVVALDGEPSGSLRKLMGVLGPGSVGGELKLTVRRGGEDRELAVSIGERREG